MEPLEMLISMIRDNTSSAIGGPPQVEKVYRHMNTIPYNIFWPSLAAGRITFYSRPSLPYERNNHLALDPDTLETIEPNIAFNRDALEAGDS